MKASRRVYDGYWERRRNEAMAWQGEVQYVLNDAYQVAVEHDVLAPK